MLYLVFSVKVHQPGKKRLLGWMYSSDMNSLTSNIKSTSSYATGSLLYDAGQLYKPLAISGCGC